MLLEQTLAKMGTKDSKGTGLYLKYLEKLNKNKVLIIDDFLMDPLDEQNMSDLMEILEDRSMRLSTIVTTQYPIKKWHSLIPDPTIADAICDRLSHTSIIINLKGESMRKKTKNVDSSDHL